VHSAPIILFALDRAGRYTLTDGQDPAIPGSAPNRIVGRSLYEAYPAPTEVHAAVRQAPAGEDATARASLGGHVFETHYVPERAEDGDVAGVIGVSTDITKQLATEVARDPLAAIVEASRDAIIGKTLDGVITSWNRGAEYIYGYTEAEAVGQPITLLARLDGSNEMADLMVRVARGEYITAYETERMHKACPVNRWAAQAGPATRAPRHDRPAFFRDAPDRRRSGNLILIQ
jgi:PAS domain-containing protein